MASVFHESETQQRSHTLRVRFAVRHDARIYTLFVENSQVTEQEACFDEFIYKINRKNRRNYWRGTKALDRVPKASCGSEQKDERARPRVSSSMRGSNPSSELSE